MSNSSLASQSSLDEKIDENLLQHLDSKWVVTRPPETPTRFAMFEIVHRVFILTPCPPVSPIRPTLFFDLRQLAANRSFPCVNRALT